MRPKLASPLFQDGSAEFSPIRVRIKRSNVGVFDGAIRSHHESGRGAIEFEGIESVVLAVKRNGEMSVVVGAEKSEEILQILILPHDAEYGLFLHVSGDLGESGEICHTVFTPACEKLENQVLPRTLARIAGGSLGFGTIGIQLLQADARGTLESIFESGSLCGISAGMGIRGGKKQNRHDPQKRELEHGFSSDFLDFSKKGYHPLNQSKECLFLKKIHTKELELIS
jgi:hypothetical protein